VPSELCHSRLLKKPARTLPFTPARSTGRPTRSRWPSRRTCTPCHSWGLVRPEALCGVAFHLVYLPYFSPAVYVGLQVLLAGVACDAPSFVLSRSTCTYHVRTLPSEYASFARATAGVVAPHPGAGVGAGAVRAPGCFFFCFFTKKI
jgi:hypothetical protein